MDRRTATAVVATMLAASVLTLVLFGMTTAGILASAAVLLSFPTFLSVVELAGGDLSGRLPAFAFGVPAVTLAVVAVIF